MVKKDFWQILIKNKMPIGKANLKQIFAVEVLKYEYILINTGSDEILRKNVDGAHLHHKDILLAKFGKIRTVRFRSCARTDIHTYIHTDGRDTPSMP